MSPFAPWGLECDEYNSVGQIKRWIRDSGLEVTKVRGAGFGFNKWLLGGFMISSWLEKKHPPVLKRYLAASLRFEEALGRRWPFNRLMEKFVVKGVRDGSSAQPARKKAPGESLEPARLS